MTDAVSIALGGLMAQARRLGAVAGNIANAATAGAVPSSGLAPAVYKPLSVSFTALAPYGVAAQVTQDASGYSLRYDPQSALADENGFIAVPDVDLTREIVALLEVKALYKANLAVIRTQEELDESLLDTIV